MEMVKTVEKRVEANRDWTGSFWRELFRSPNSAKVRGYLKLVEFHLKKVEEGTREQDKPFLKNAKKFIWSLLLNTVESILYNSSYIDGDDGRKDFGAD